MVNTQVEGAALCRIVARRPAPDGEQRLLRQFLGELRAGAQPHQVALHARGEVIEHGGERRAIAAFGRWRGCSPTAQAGRSGPRPPSSTSRARTAGRGGARIPLTSIVQPCMPLLRAQSFAGSTMIHRARRGRNLCTQAERADGPGERQVKIAVVGAGIAGMSAAWLLVQAPRGDGLRGGGPPRRPQPHGRGARRGRRDARRHGLHRLQRGQLSEPDRRCSTTWTCRPRPSDMSFAVSAGRRRARIRRRRPDHPVRPAANLLRPRFWSMLRDLVRFYREAPAASPAPGRRRPDQPGRLSRRGGYGRAFQDDHLLPQAAAIWSASVERDPRLSGRRLHPLLREPRPAQDHRPADLAHGGRRQPRLCRALTAAYADRVAPGRARSSGCDERRRRRMVTDAGGRRRSVRPGGDRQPRRPGAGHAGGADARRNGALLGAFATAATTRCCTPTPA